MINFAFVQGIGQKGFPDWLRVNTYDISLFLVPDFENGDKNMKPFFTGEQIWKKSENYRRKTFHF